MTTDNYADALAFVLKAEGGYTDDPHDPGGITNRGVTKAAWEAYVGHAVTAETMRDLTVEDVTPFYRTRYWDRVCGDALPPALAFLCFEFGVNTGPVTAVKCLQKAVGTDVDGEMGPATLGCAERCNQRNAVANIGVWMQAYYRALPKFPVYGRGWLNRVNEAIAVANGLLPKVPVAVAPPFPLAAE